MKKRENKFQDPVKLRRLIVDLINSENLPDPGILAQEIVEDLEAALGLFREIAEDLNEPETDDR